MMMISTAAAAAAAAVEPSKLLLAVVPSSSSSLKKKKTKRRLLLKQRLLQRRIITTTSTSGGTSSPHWGRRHNKRNHQPLVQKMKLLLQLLFFNMVYINRIAHALYLPTTPSSSSTSKNPKPLQQPIPKPLPLPPPNDKTILQKNKEEKTKNTNKKKQQQKQIIEMIDNEQSTSNTATTTTTTGSTADTSCSVTSTSSPSPSETKPSKDATSSSSSSSTSSNNHSKNETTTIATTDASAPSSTNPKYKGALTDHSASESTTDPSSSSSNKNEATTTTNPKYKGGPTTLPQSVLDYYQNHHTNGQEISSSSSSSSSSLDGGSSEESSLQPVWVDSLNTGSSVQPQQKSIPKKPLDPFHLFSDTATISNELAIFAATSSSSSSSATVTTSSMDIHIDTATSNTNNKPFSLLSWNILVQSLYENQKHQQYLRQQTTMNQYYPQFAFPNFWICFEWEQRLDWIMTHINQVNSDIVCLQEVEIDQFYDDILPKMKILGYDGVVQGDASYVHEIKRRKGKSERAHVVATFWKIDRFQPYEVLFASVETNTNPNAKQKNNNKEGNFPAAHMARGRTMTTLLQDISTSSLSNDDNNNRNAATTKTEETIKSSKKSKDKKRHEEEDTLPVLGIINCHLEGHPRQYAARIRQLQHAMNDLSKRISPMPTTTASKSKTSHNQNHPINGLIISGDFNCELQSSACSTYLRMGRIGRKGGLGGVHGTSAMVLPPSLLESQEALEILNPVLEWGHAIPNDELEQVKPHPFRRNSMVSAYPPKHIVGPYEYDDQDDNNNSDNGDENGNGYDYFYTYCANPHRPVAGLDQIWYSKSTMTCKALKRPVATKSSAQQILDTGLPAPNYPSDHLPIGSIWEWRFNNEQQQRAKINNKDPQQQQQKEVRELVVAQDQPVPQPKPKSPIMAYAELDMLIVTLPYDTEFQRNEVEELMDLSDVVTSQLPDGGKPSAEQLAELRAIRTRKQDLFRTASPTTKPLLQRVFKLKKQVTAYEQEFFGGM